MARVIIALLLMLICRVEAQAQPWWEYLDRTPERIIGLLNLPDVVGEGCGTERKQTPVPMYDAPTRDSRRAGMFFLLHDDTLGCVFALQGSGGAQEPAPTLESGYEIPAAPVYERRGAWFRVALRNGSAWVRHNDPKDFLPYPDILRDSLSYIQQGWDGTLRETAGSSGRAVPLPSGWRAYMDRQLNIDYLGSRRVGNDLWVHVRLITEQCDQSLDGVTLVEGWIPAYRSNRSPTAWFASRGC